MESGNHPATESNLVGKTIAKILQTPWEHSEEYSYCQFFIEFTDGSLVGLDDDSCFVIDEGERAMLNLQDIDIDSDVPAFWTTDGFSGIGATIQRVLEMTYGGIYLQLSGQYFLHGEYEEEKTLLGLNNYDSFLYWPRVFEFFDYWTKEPVIFENMRAIDVVITSSVNDLKLWRFTELFLTIGRVKDGNVSDLLSTPNQVHGTGWKARFVVPEPGSYRVMVQRQHGEFVADVEIDEATISKGHVEVHIA